MRSKYLFEIKTPERTNSLAERTNSQAKLYVLVVMGNYGEPTCIRDLYKIYLSNVFSQQHVAAKTYTKPKLLFFFQSYVSLSDLKLWQSSSSPLSGIYLGYILFKVAGKHLE